MLGDQRPGSPSTRRRRICSAPGGAAGLAGLDDGGATGAERRREEAGLGGLARAVDPLEADEAPPGHARQWPGR